MGRTRIVILIALTLTVIICANSQTRRSHAGGAAKLKAKEVLVDKLPDGVEGVELKDGAIRVKPGYKFVKEGKSVRVMARRAGGGGNGLSGTFECYCKSGNGGSCNAVIANGVLACSGGTCTSCDMSIVVNGLKTALLSY